MSARLRLTSSTVSIGEWLVSAVAAFPRVKLSA